MCLVTEEVLLAQQKFSMYCILLHAYLKHCAHFIMLVLILNPHKYWHFPQKLWHNMLSTWTILLQISLRFHYKFHWDFTVNLTEILLKFHCDFTGISLCKFHCDLIEFHCDLTGISLKFGGISENDQNVPISVNFSGISVKSQSHFH